MGKTIDFNQGWEFLLLGVAKLKNILQGLPEPDFTMGDCMMLYTTVYEMCVQKHPCDYSQQLYDKYPEIFEDYLTSTVLPSLGNALDNECMLRQLVKAWENQKVMVKFLSRVFQYLERSLRCLPTLNEVGMICFRDVVYNNVKEDVIDLVISLIGQEREGQKIDQALVKNVVEIFVEMGMGQLYCYENDFEMAMLDDTCQYYSQKASKWIVEESSEDYMLKAEECLKQEKNRVTHYLHPTSELKLLYKVQNVFESQFIEKEHSGYNALLEETRGMVASLRIETGPSDDFMI